MRQLRESINAYFLFDSLKDQLVVQKNRCITIQNYSFKMERSRKENGEVYDGQAFGNLMNLTLIIGSKDSMKPFYSRGKDLDTSMFSILFSAHFDDNDILKSYDTAIIVDGFIVNIEEDYDIEEESQGEQMKINIQILVKNMIFTDEDHIISYSA